MNIDLTADELISRLKEGKIYDHTKVQQALTNFFQPEKILQLRELALKEVAGQVERKVDYEVTAKEKPFGMNVFWPVFLPIMKLHNASFAKLQGWLLITTANGMYCMCKLQKNQR